MNGAGGIPVAVQGLGPMGRVILGAAQRDPRLDVVAAVDIDPAMVGRSLSDLDLAPQGVVVAATLPPAPEGGVLLHATGSYLETVAGQFEAALAAGWHVVSTCEELSYPFVRHPALAASLDAAARAAGRSLLGTGVNPGLLMDRLPVFLTSASSAIRSIAVERVQNPTSRRLPFQRKVGMGLSRADFDAKAAGGGFGHVGLEESGRLIAAGLGWRIDAWIRELRPVQPDPNAPVRGLVETLTGATGDGRRVSLHFEAQSGVAEPYDAVTVEGTPPLSVRFHGGVLGDAATAAAVVRAAHVLPSAARGLITVLDLPLRHRPSAG